MRIGVNCFMLQPHIGGLKQYFLLLFDYLLQHDTENTYSFFYFPHNQAELEKLSVSTWKQTAVQLQSQDDIARHLPTVDLYFCPFGALWPRPVPLPSVVMLADVQEAFFPQFFTLEDLFNRAWHFPGSTRAADRVITISEFSRNSIARHHDLPDEKVKVAPLCADPHYLQPELDEPIELPFAQYIFYPANRWQHKNHDVVLKALALLKEQGTIVNCVFTGMDVAGGYPLRDSVRNLGLEDRVHIAEYVSRGQMAYLYRHAELLVFPSLFEGFGMPVLEAMACGCPVAVARTTSLPEICGEAADYFDPTSPQEVANAVQGIRAHPARRQDLIIQGRRRASFYTVKRTAEAHQEIFREAARAYSKTRYLWHKLYQPWHTWKTRRAYR